MYKNRQTLWLFMAVLAVSFTGASGAEAKHGTLESKRETTASAAAWLWRNPTDIPSRNLFYGPGGKERQPHGPFTFLKEDRDGTNPKLEVQDRDGVKWKVKLGEEARPETVA